MSARHHGRRGRPWRRIREQVLARDRYLCQIRGPGCTRRATTVEHIQPLALRPDLAHELSNLCAACLHCNSAGGARMTNAKARGRLLRRTPPRTTALRW